VGEIPRSVLSGIGLGSLKRLHFEKCIVFALCM
jgi:hypothetical protein